MAFEENLPEPSLPLSRNIVYSFIGGFLITLLTSIFPNNTVIGASNFGYPFPWLSQPLYPIGSPPTIIWEGLLIAIIVWTIVAFVILIVYQFLKSK